MRWWSWIVLWILISGSIGAAVLLLSTAQGFAARAQSASGEVTSVEPTNHAIVRAVFTVDGKSHQVADSFIGRPNPDFDHVRVGDTVTVFYDPADPGRAILSDPQARAANERGFAVLAAVLLGSGSALFLIISLSLARRIRFRSSSPRIPPPGDQRREVQSFDERSRSR